MNFAPPEPPTRPPLTLNHWSVQTIPVPYQAPETWDTKVVGKVQNHPAFPTDASVTLPRIVGKRGDKVVDAEGVEWVLGTVDPEYEARFPNAQQRLTASLPPV